MRREGKDDNTIKLSWKTLLIMITSTLVKEIANVSNHNTVSQSIVICFRHFPCFFFFPDFSLPGTVEKSIAIFCAVVTISFYFN